MNFVRVIVALAAYFAASALTPAMAARKAFLIGINDYAHVPKLRSPVADAERLAAKLQVLEYTVEKLVAPDDTTRSSLLIRWQSFLNKLSEGDDVVIYYSGHGVEVGGTNFMVPRDSPDADTIQGEATLKDFLISFPKMIADLDGKRITASIWIIDACRDNPFVETKSLKALGVPKGLNKMDGPQGTFVFYAANFGQTALDGIPQTLPNSLYTSVLADAIGSFPTIPVTEIAIKIRQTVYKLAKDPPNRHEQFPAYYDALYEPWCFGGCPQAVASVSDRYITPTGGDGAVVGAPGGRSASGSGQQRKSAPSIEVPGRNAANAVFLGKLSNVDTCDGKPADAYPFGCRALREVSAGRFSDYVGRPLTARTDAKMLKTVPTASEKAAGTYSCVVDTIAAGAQVTLSGILVRQSGGDTFYWGTVAAPPKDCARSETARR